MTALPTSDDPCPICGKPSRLGRPAESQALCLDRTCTECGWHFTSKATRDAARRLMDMVDEDLKEMEK